MDPILFFEKESCIDCNNAALKVMKCERKDMLLGMSLSKCHR